MSDPYEDVALLLEAAPLPLRVVGMPTGEMGNWREWVEEEDSDYEPEQDYYEEEPVPLNKAGNQMMTPAFKKQRKKIYDDQEGVTTVAAELNAKRERLSKKIDKEAQKEE